MAREAYLEKFDGGIRVYVRATPNASKDEIVGEWRGEDTRAGADVRLAVKVAAPPDKGKANAAKFLEDNKAVAEEIEKAIRDKLLAKPGKAKAESESDAELED